MKLKEPDLAQGLTAGHDVGLEIARLEIRRAVAKPLRELRALVRGLSKPASLDDDQCAKCRTSVTVESGLEWEKGDLCHPCAGTFARDAIDAVREAINELDAATKARGTR